MLVFLSISNLLAFLVVVLVQQFGLLAIHYPSEYGFYMALVLWAIAGLVKSGGFKSCHADNDGSIYAEKLRQVQNMIDGHDFQADKQQNLLHNSNFSLRLFIAGLLPMLSCFML